ncbi:Protein kinase byr2 [Penicillium chermesinum]|nr:Protein kinase byr2 [Penicillium chermesinum]
MLASKPQYATTGSSAQTPSSAYYANTPRPMTATKVDGSGFLSPTKSELSDGQEDGTSVRMWDEDKVAAWLHSIKCGQYESLFRENGFNGDNLIDCDQKILQEMGIKKVGDRVRIFVAIKQLRNKTMVNPRQKNMSRLASMEAAMGNIEPSRFSGFPNLNNVHGGKSSQPTSPPAEALRKDYLGRSTNSHPRNPSLDGLTMGPLPQNSPVIRVIYTGGQTKVLDIRHCKTPDEVMVGVLKKLQLPEHQYRNYCFYVLDGLDPDMSNVRRLTEAELMEICEGVNRSERGRLILRKIHAGEPDGDELCGHLNLLLMKVQSRIVINTKQPVSPVGARHRTTPSNSGDPDSPYTAERNHVSKLRSFFGQRPPSEMIIHELPSFFPSHDRDDIAKTMRRSQRLSRAASRLSVVSNFSVASSMKDAPPMPPLPSIPPIPPMPNIADAWLQHAGGIQAAQAPRPQSISRFNLPQASYRDSIASSSLQPLQEDSDDPNTSRQSMLDDTMSVAATDGESELFNDRASMAVAEDELYEEDEDDPGLEDFLAGNNFAPKNWMKGSLIGEGSFGSVSRFPSATKGTEFDQRKNSMVTALKHEIELLQGMHHPNIVQYLGTAADDQHLNIFLEYVPGGSIATMLKQYNTFQEPLVKNFVRQILAGLAYLHSEGIIHRDIKGANILVDNKGGVKISDFGISKRVEATHLLGARASGSAGTGGGLARPSLQGTDIWSLGCLVVEMFSGAHPFPDSSQLQAIFAIGSNQARPPAPEHVSPEAKEFLDMTFQIDHEKRPTAEELLKCKFLAMPNM